MPRQTTNPKSSANASDTTSDSVMLRAVLWAVFTGAWLLLVMSLLSYDPADPPTLTHGVINQPPNNWVGGVGAWIAHQTYLVLGPGAWLGLIGVGVILVLAGSGWKITQLPLRLLGLVMMAVSASAVVGVAGPSMVEGIRAGPHAPGGLIAMFVNDQMTGRFGLAGSLIILAIGFWIGAVLAADRIVLAIPQAIAVALGGLSQIPAVMPRLPLSRLGKALAWLNPMRWMAALTRPVIEWFEHHLHREPDTEGRDASHRPPTAAARLGQARKHEQTEAIDEQAGGFAATESFDSSEPRPSAADEREDLEDEASDEQMIEGEEEPAEEASEEEESAQPSNKFDPESLRAKMKQLPINFAPKTENKQEIPREPDFSGYEFPGLDLLEEPETNFTQEMEQIVRDQAVELEGALREYKIQGEVVGIDSGPVITLFEVRLSPGTKVSRLNTVDSDLARAMRAQNIRIVPNMAGKDTVGIEVPNLKKERVRLKELMQADPDAAAAMNLPMFLGKDASGNPLIEDLNAMPHILIAGTTGSGKSVCMNSVIMSFLYTKKPDELKLVLVDPKMVEMSMFKNIPHLMCPVVTEMGKAAAILEWAVTKMDERYELLAEAGVRDISDYNDLGWEEIKERMEPATESEEARIPKKLPYMVFIVDELADLMMTNKEVEASIVRIAQKARAVGIHLILATQRPQANVVTGLIKSNMPGRAAFKVASGMDSRIVLDQKGGELLLGHGDMLFLSPRQHKLTRAQGTLVGDGEIRKTVKALKSISEQNFEPTLVQLKSGGSSDGEDEDAGDTGERDELFEQAVEVVLETSRGSVSLLQRRLTVGYSRASRIIEQIADAGILGPYKGSQAREVVISEEEWEAMKAQARADAQAQTQADTEEDDPDHISHDQPFEPSGEDDSEEDLEGAPAVYEHSHITDNSPVPDELDDEYRQ